MNPLAGDAGGGGGAEITGAVLMRTSVRRQAEVESKDWPVSIERCIKRLRLIGGCGERNTSRACQFCWTGSAPTGRLIHVCVCDKNESKQSKGPHETA